MADGDLHLEGDRQGFERFIDLFPLPARAGEPALAVFAVSAAARSNSARASSPRPSLSSRSPRTLGSRWYLASAGSAATRRPPPAPPAGPRHGHRDGAVQLDDRRPGARASSPYSSAIRSQSVSRHVRARAWQAAMAACSCTGPGGRPSAPRPLEPASRAGSAAGPSAHGPGRAAGSARPSASTRALAREAWISISATRPCTSGSPAPSRPGSAPGAARPRSAPAASSPDPPWPNSPR